MKPSALIRAPTASMPILSNRVHSHARFEAFRKAAGWTPLPVERGYVALGLARVTRENLFVLNGALEEAFAGLARERPVVEARDLVAAYGTRADRLTVSAAVCVRVVVGAVYEQD